jgi:transcriptional regulator with XRE-family HTH domain
MNYDCYFSSDKLLKSILEEIRETIKDRHPSGITQELLASELGISREQLSRLLNGEYTMRSDYLIYLIVRLGLNKAYFNR